MQGQEGDVVALLQVGRCESRSRIHRGAVFDGMEYDDRIQRLPHAKRSCTGRRGKPRSIRSAVGHRQ